MQGAVQQANSKSKTFIPIDLILEKTPLGKRAGFLVVSIPAEGGDDRVLNQVVFIKDDKFWNLVTDQSIDWLKLENVQFKGYLDV